MDVLLHRMTRPLARSAVAVAALIIAGCGDGGAGAPDTATSTRVSVETTVGPVAATTTPSTSVPAESTDAPATTTATTLDGDPAATEGKQLVEVDVVGCDQVATNTGVDRAQAAAFVPDDQELFLDGGGFARVVMVTKTCDDFVVNGESLGPGHMDTLWIRVLGPAEGVPESPDEEGRSTDTFVPQFILTDNAAYSQALAAHGVPMLLADMIDADPPGTDGRSGGATSSTFDPPLSYSWTIPESGPATRSGFVTHLLRGIDTDGSPIRYDIGCPYDITDTGPITVEFEPDGPFEALVATGWTSRANEMRLDCRIVIEPR